MQSAPCARAGAAADAASSILSYKDVGNFGVRCVSGGESIAQLTGDEENNAGSPECWSTEGEPAESGSGGAAREKGVGGGRE
jgi:hypothetical protein